MDKSAAQSEMEFDRDAQSVEKYGSANDTFDMERMGKQQTLRVRLTLRTSFWPR
jgi:hypothetical protein